MLLQYGIDPRSTNTRGLKAVDLAIRNKQEKSREVLTEYHLHYCTTSDFDSVLFLKTLEGHRNAKKYECKNYSSQILSTDEMDTGDADIRVMRGLEKKRSEFSMKDKSVHMQRWGSWLSYTDPHSDREYWFNHLTSKGQFEKPDKVIELQAEKNGPESPNKKYMEIKNATNMKLRKQGNWIEYVTEQGKTFYYNEKNGDFQWVPPDPSRGILSIHICVSVYTCIWI